MASSSGSFFGSIRNRLLFGTALLVTVPLIIMALVLAYFAARQSEQSLRTRANEQLQSIRVGKSEEVRAYFDAIANQMSVIARTDETRRTLTALTAALPNLPASLPVPMADAREAVGGYYRDAFAARYRERNANAPDVTALLAAQTDATVAAQYWYISQNTHPLGQKGNLDVATGDTSAYSAAHAAFHPFARQVVQRNGLYDFFLIDLDGNVVYTYFKELDFATNLKSGPWAKSGLGEAFALGETLSAGEVKLTDYAPYTPSYEDQASFAVTPVFDGERRVGAFVVQLPIDRVNAIMTYGGQWKAVGLGDTGEVYLLGADKTPRSVSRFLQQDKAAFVAALKQSGAAQDRVAAIEARSDNIGLMLVDTQGARDALAGKAGVAVYPDYRRQPVLGAYAPVQVLSQSWAILAEIDQSEADAPVAALRKQILYAALALLAVMGLVAVVAGVRLAKSINVPLAHFNSVVAQLASGQDDARVKLPPTDEIGKLATTFDQMLDDRIATQQRISVENDHLNNSVVEIMVAVAELASRNLTIKVPVAEDVTGAVSDAINMMTRSTASALTSVRRISDTVSETSQSVRQRSDQVHDVANEASDQATAASAELQQTAMALRAMGDQAKQAEAQAERAIATTGQALEIVRATVDGISQSRDQIRETEKRVKRLAERSQEITAVVNIIGQIAERTSVLALNASMQAVAAGEAGRGFAVVADEVKRLAENARQATQQIGALVGAIQADAGDTIQAMNGTIAQVVDISRLADQAGGQMNDTRAATEQLVAAVQNIAGSTQAQSEASRKLLTRAYDLLQSSQRTLEEIEAQRRDAETLANSAQDLVATVGEFRLPD